MNYYTRIRDLREDNDLSQKTVADYLGIRQSDYSQYELGKHMMGIDKYIRLAEYYNISLDYLTGLSDTPRPLRSPKNLTAKTLMLVEKYNAQPKWQSAVDKLLGIE